MTKRSAFSGTGTVKGIVRPKYTGPVSEGGVKLIREARERLGYDGEVEFVTAKVKARSGGKRRVHSVSLSDEAYDGLLLLAREHGCAHGSHWSVSELIERVGLYRFVLTKTD